MSFQTGLSGLNAASKNLDVIGHNISNSNTIGMKSSRAEFAALVASAAGPSGGGGAGGSGIGVAVATVSQQFSQGTINITGNNLDLAINGGGFFQVKLPDGTAGYTRDGQFKLDNKGNLKTNAGANVMGVPTDLKGTPTSTTIQPLTVPTGAPIPAKITTKITSEFNLDARAKVATSVNPPTPITTYGTSLNGFDSQGVATPVNMYFVKVGPDFSAAPPVLQDTWSVFDTATLASGTEALTTNAAAMADPANTAIKAANAVNSALHITNTAINKANADLDTKNTALNAANAALDAKNTALNGAIPLPAGWVTLPTYALGTIPKLPTKLLDGLSTFTPSAPTGTVIPKITSDLLPTFDEAGTGATAGPVIVANTALIGSVSLPSLFSLSFDVNGTLIPPAAPPSITLTSKNPTIGNFSAELDLSTVTQYGTGFSVSNLTQDGYTSGTLTAVSINEQGILTTSYSNGQNQSKGQIQLADFRNVQGLKPTGGGNWTETDASGQPTQGAPAQGNFGGLRAGALESSNVDLTAELVSMMTAQRDYQANAQTIKTQDQVLSTLVNLR